MFYLKLMLLVLVLAVAGGCANQAMDYAVSSWQNQQDSAVIAAWGRPSEELKVNGKHLLLWNTNDGKLALPDQKRPASLPNAWGCVRLLEVDISGKIVSGAWEGNNCPGWLSGWYK
jgi:hypothetical protein